MYARIESNEKGFTKDSDQYFYILLCILTVRTKNNN